MIERDEYLELVSDKIRKGEPVGFLEAIAAINYQGHLQAEREANRWHRRFGRWLGAKAKFRKTTP